MESDKTKDSEANTEPEEERRDRNLHMYPQCDHPGSASLTVEVAETMGTKVQFLENQNPKVGSGGVCCMFYLFIEEQPEY